MCRVKTKNILIRDNIILDIYLIGYRHEGESIVFIIYADGAVFYSGVIDCYEYNDLNKTIEILEKEKIAKLDFICWTHPDKDHSIGIDKLINSYAGERTKVFLPGHINGEEYQYNERIRDTFRYINETVASKKRKKFKVRDVSDNQILHYMQFTDAVRKVYEFKISSIAPNSTILRANDFRKTIKKNDYSIGLILNLGEFNCLFAGDIENRTIDNMEDFYIPEVIDYIKIPHHASESSDKLLEYLDYENKCGLACTTVFRTSNLPKKNIIKRYEKYVRELYSTGKVGYDDMCDYGIIHVKCDIINKRMKTILKGNSERLYKMGGT